MIVCVGIVPPGASGVRDYGRLLVEEWARQGRPAADRWIVGDGHRAGSSLAAARDLLREAAALRRGSVALWHYSSMAAGYRGIPLPGVCFSLAARARGATVITVLHEPTYPWGLRGWRGRLQSAAQWAALVPVVAGSAALVVTKDDRARQVGRLVPRRRRHLLRMLPVFATVPVARPGPAGPAEPAGPAGGRTSAAPVIGVVAFSGDGARPDLVVEAARTLDGEPSLLLVGSPGSVGPQAEEWRRLARAAGLAERLTFTEVVSSEDLSRHLQRCTVVVFANDEGPSGRRTTVANTLGHGLPLVAFDGPGRWAELCDSGAVRVVPPRAEALRAALDGLLASPAEAAALGARGKAFYEERMALPILANALGALVDEAAGRVEAATTGAASTRRSSPPA